MKNLDKSGVLKMTIAIVAVVIVIVVAAGIILLVNNDNNNSNGVTYYGNGGSNEGVTSYTYTNTTVMSNLFSYNDYMFTGWNTDSNGNGTSYVAGDTVSNGTKLYAQWTQNYFTETSVIGTSTLAFSLNVYIGSTEQILLSSGISCGNLTYSSSDYFDISLSGASEWTVGDNCLTFSYDDQIYSLTISLSDATSTTYLVTTGGSASMSFSATGQQEASFTIMSVS